MANSVTILSEATASSSIFSVVATKLFGKASYREGGCLRYQRNKELAVSDFLPRSLISVSRLPKSVLSNEMVPSDTVKREVKSPEHQI